MKTYQSTVKQIIIISLLFLGTIQLQGQPYFFSQYTQSYTNLSNTISINNGNIWSGFQTFTVPIGFSFDFMGNSFNSVELEATGRLIFDVNHYYFADMFVVSGMEDKGTSSSLSPLSYKLTGSVGTQILKIEINNATYQNDPASTVNYQIWLYEESSTIELHMGPNTINNPSLSFPSGPFSGVYHITTFSPVTYGYGLALFGNPLLPTDTTFSGTGINTSNIILNNIPNNSMVYQFTDDTITSAIKTVETDDYINVYPNPTSRIINIDLGKIKTNLTATLTNCLGQIILFQQFESTDFISLDIDAPSGIYFLQIESGGKIKSLKLLKE